MNGRKSADASVRLSRDTKPLLKFVAGHERNPSPSSSGRASLQTASATKNNLKRMNFDDRKKPLSKQPAAKIRVPGRSVARARSVEDLDRDPSSSDDDDDVSLISETYANPPRSSTVSIVGAGNNTSGTSFDVSDSPKRALRSAAQPPSSARNVKSSHSYGCDGSATGDKRKANEMIDQVEERSRRVSPIEDDWAEFQRSSQSTGRQQRRYGSKMQGSQTSKTSSAQAGKGNKSASQQEDSTKTKRPGFKMPGQLEEYGSKPKFKEMKIRQDDTTRKKTDIAKAAFRIPTTSIDETFARSRYSMNLIDSDATSDFSSPPPELIAENAYPQLQSTPRSSPPRQIFSENTPCPVCRELVSADLLNTFRAGRKLRFKDQQRFCEHHRRNTAIEQWSANAYPTIDWSALPTRLATHDVAISAILDRRTHSHYRAALSQGLTGSAKSRHAFLKDHVDPVPGYYGHRGTQAMMKYLMTRHRAKLKELAVADELVVLTGVPAYVQAVLVPELAVLLVEEDMRVGREKARDIMEQSAEAGGLVYPEEEEIVEWYGGEDDDGGWW